MAKFDASNAQTGVNMIDHDQWGFVTEDAPLSSVNYSWLTADGTDAHARGNGFAFSGGMPTSGFVESLEFDFGNDGFLNPDVVVSEVKRDLTDITSTPTGQFFTDMLSGDDTITGGAHNDRLYGFDGDDTIKGGGGTNYIYGGNGNDTITENGTDVVTAGADNDHIRITSNVVGDGDIWSGGSGVDTLDFRAVSGSIFLHAIDLAQGKWIAGPQTEIISGFENVEGNEEANVIYGNDSANVLSGNGGGDSIVGGGGHDTLIGGTGADDLDGGAGNDTFLFHADHGDGVNGDLFFDVATGGNGYDRVLLKGDDAHSVFDFNDDFAAIDRTVEEIEFDGGGANADKTLIIDDKYIGSFGYARHIDGNDVVGSTEKIEIHVKQFNELDISHWTFQDWGGQSELISITGDDDAETITGSTEDDVIFGYDGNDVLDGNSGNNSLFGGGGDDVLKLSESAAGELDYLGGGAGRDMADFSGFNAAVWAKLDYNDVEGWTQDHAGLSGGTWREIADLDKIEDLGATDYSDVLGGDAGDNAFVFNSSGAGAGGFDSYDGGSGADMADFAGASFAVWADLGFGGNEAWTMDEIDLSGGTWREIADLNNIESLGATRYSDFLAGDAADNTFAFYSTAAGNGGLDHYDGRGGNDTADFSGASYAVWADLGYNAAEVWTKGAENLSTGTWREIANLDNIENLGASDYSDDLRGDAGDNSFVFHSSDAGTGGFDRYDGRGGSDTADFSGASYAVWADLGYSGAEAWTKGGTDLAAGSWREIADVESVENLAGSDFADDLRGDASANVIAGGAGDDILTGRGGADTFEFRQGDGDDTVTDFTDGLELIRFHDVGSFGDLDITDSGAGAVIDYGADTITLAGVSAAQLDVTDFDFIV